MGKFRASNMLALFLCSEYIQDERLLSIWHNVYVEAACVKFAQRLFTCLAAKAAWSLISRHAVNPSMGARARCPISHGLETRDHTPSAMWYSNSGGF